MQSSGIAPDPSPHQSGVAAQAVRFAHHVENARRPPTVAARPSGWGRDAKAFEPSGANDVFQLVAGEDPGVIQPRIQGGYLSIDDRTGILPFLEGVIRERKEILEDATVMIDASTSGLALGRGDEMFPALARKSHEGRPGQRADAGHC